MLKTKGLTTYSLWVEDSTGDLRISTTRPQNTDNIPELVGTQTSLREAKNIIGEVLEPAAALAKLVSATVYDFTYKKNERDIHHGVMADEFPEIMWDQGRAFSPVSAFGFTIQAIKELVRRVEILEGEV